MNTAREADFKQTCETNKMKNYCKDNNITLIEIPYEDKDKINWEYLKEKCNL